LISVAFFWFPSPKFNFSSIHSHLAKWHYPWLGSISTNQSA
jgi:hypothetical protein